MIGNSLFNLSPHPNLLPQGEGIATIIEMYEFMSSVHSTKLIAHSIRELPHITVSLTGQL